MKPDCYSFTEHLDFSFYNTAYSKILAFPKHNDFSLKRKLFEHRRGIGKPSGHDKERKQGVM